MYVYFSKITNPYINLATEEYLFKTYSTDFFLIYLNSPSLIIGKHQNAIAEINNTFAHTNKIPIIRRISGGGTVYHDLGNINFSFLLNGTDGRLIDFQKYTLPVIEALKNIGVQAEIGFRNNIFIQDKKISGNAEHLFKNRILHHGTLLFNTDLEILEKSIKNNSHRFTDKAIKSVYSKVTNIISYQDKFTDNQEFAEYILNFVAGYFINTQLFTLSEKEQNSIKNLAESKYQTTEWIYGYSPEFIFKNSVQEYSVEIKIKNGLVKELDLIGFSNQQTVVELNRLFTNQYLTYENIHELLSQINNKNSEYNILQQLLVL